ncbi:MAG: penicillin-binding protein 1C [Deltaproteobacteria bacterium]|nr:penicillin-binding protein 1C [Deltaproteobacteria bacterium]
MPELKITRWKKFFLAVAVTFSMSALLWWFFAPRPPLLDGVSFSAAVYDRSGRLMRLSLAQDEKFRIFTPLKNIVPTLREATLLYEDRYFYSHPGINPVALFRAAYTSYLSGGRRMGASTITMQLARLRLNQDTTTIWGKLKQMERALAYERYYSKDELFEAYLNLAPYGGNIEGCGAAAQIYFQKDPLSLDLIESLSLVTVPQNPAMRNPLAVQRGYASGTADTALEEARARMYSLWLEKHPEDAGSAFMHRQRLKVYTPADLVFRAPHVTDEALQLFPAGTEIHTTIDQRQQTLLENMISKMVQRHKELGVENSAAILVHWPTMEVRALVGSADFFNAAIEGQIDGSRARRSPGSTLKPFIYALALDQGLIHPRTLLYDTPRSFRGYDPENADQEFRGPLFATEALQLSRNIPAIALANRLSKPDLYEFMREAGVKFDYGREHYGLALVLGGAEVSMRELAALYAVLPNKGKYRDLVLYKNEQGKSDQDTAGRQLLSPEAAIVALRMLHSLPANQRVQFASIVPRIPMYWKTGTSNGTRDAWTAGVFGPYVLVVWAGNFNNRSNPNFVGLKVAAPLFWDVADAIGNMENLRDAAMQGLDKLNLIRIKVCSATGDVDTSLCRDTAETWFIPGVSPIADSGVYRRILIDKATGLRACVEDPEKTDRVVVEYWPTDLSRLFRRAGIIKTAPPPFLPACAGSALTSYGSGVSGIPPEILSPRSGVVYHRNLTHPENTVISLHASGDADVTDFYWFSGKTFIGHSTIDEHFLWTPPGGKSTVSVLDNFGRTASVKIEVVQSE